LALDPQSMQLIAAAMQQRQGVPQPAAGLPPLLGGQQAPQQLLGGIGQPNFADVLGGVSQDAFMQPAMALQPTPMAGAMPQPQMQMPAAAPMGQPSPFGAPAPGGPTQYNPASMMIGDLFTKANNNSPPPSNLQQKQLVARQNVLPIKQQAGVLGGAPMGVQRL
jgi:hypothetical protein